MNSTSVSYRWRIPRPRQPLIAAAAVLAAVVAAYANSFDGVFVLDDLPAIVNNPSIRSLWPPGPVLAPPLSAVTVAGRPLLNLTLALNYAVGGTDPWGYHAVNLALHLLNALLLLGILRRTFRLPRLSDHWRGPAGPEALAGAIALFWAVHPLQTAAVTYVVQRAESLVAFFYLLTLYAVIRAAGGNRPGPWSAVAVFACLLGMASKEVMVTAPVLALLYDRALLAGSFRTALRTRPLLYAGLAATWILLAYLVLATGLLATLPDPEVPGWWEYARSQPAVIGHYLKLSFWPASLCLYYDWPVAATWTQWLPAMVVIGALLVLSAWGLVRNRAWAPAAAAFFLILAPTSSVLPLRQLAFEHRMFLPLAAVLTLALLVVNRLAAAAANRRWLSDRQARGLALALAVVATAAMVGATHRRNADYASEIAIWRDTVAKAPHSALAHNNLGLALTNNGLLSEAVVHYRKAISLRPDFVLAHSNLGRVLLELNQSDEAEAHLRQALSRQPSFPEPYINMGFVLAREQRYREAAIFFRKAIAADPNFAEAYNNLGLALVRLDRNQEAILHFQRAVAIKPDYTEAINNLGLALAHNGSWSEAVHCYRKALAARPDFAQAHINLGLALTRDRRWEEAIDHYRQAIEAKPDMVEAHNSMGLALIELGRVEEADRHFLAALAIDPNGERAHFNRATLLISEGRPQEGIRHLRTALGLKPEFAEAHHQLGLALYRLGRRQESIAHYRAALTIDPDLAEAHNHLGLALADQGLTDPAIDHFQRALGLRPDLAEAHNNLGLTRAAQGRLEAAVGHYQRALQIDPGLVQARHNLGGTLASDGRCDRAIVHFVRAIELDPGLAETHNSLAVCLFRLGRTDQALYHFREAIRIKPGYAAARRNLRRVEAIAR